MSQLDGYDDPNISYKIFLSKYTEIYNLSFPLRKVKANKNSISKPWLSKGLLKSVKLKNRLYKKYLSNPTIENEMTYKRYKNKLNHSVRIAKSLHYAKEIRACKIRYKGNLASS